MTLSFSVKRLTWLTACVVILVILLGGILILLNGMYHHQWDSPFVRRFAGMVSSAKVGDQKISYAEYLKHVDAQTHYLSGPAARALGYPSTLTKAFREQALERMIRMEMVEQMAKERGVIVTPLDVDRTFSALIARTTSSTSPEEIRGFIFDQFGWTEAEFQRYIIRPGLIEDILSTKRLQETNDPEAFSKEIEARLKSGDVKRYLAFS
ncbi:hypothetical protein FJZ48_01930 [Candidatus Uhrbacteria bacterium]|nr:hypothetical protein [Candidatus Uhrbacteria bacterium]